MKFSNDHRLLDRIFFEAFHQEKSKKNWHKLHKFEIYFSEDIKSLIAAGKRNGTINCSKKKKTKLDIANRHQWNSS